MKVRPAEASGILIYDSESDESVFDNNSCNTISKLLKLGRSLGLNFQHFKRWAFIVGGQFCGISRCPFLMQTWCITSETASPSYGRLPNRIIIPHIKVKYK